MPVVSTNLVLTVGAVLHLRGNSVMPSPSARTGYGTRAIQGIGAKILVTSLQEILRAPGQLTEIYICTAAMMRHRS